MMVKIVNKLIDVLSLIIVLLFLTGGIWGDSVWGRWEISQLNGPVLLLIILLFIRFIFLRNSSSVKPYCVSWGEKTIEFLEKKDSKKRFVILLLLTGYYCIVMGMFVIKRHFGFQTNAYDLGLFDQILWNSAHGNILISSLKGNVTYLTDHFSPILIVLVPVYKLFYSPFTLLVLQTIVLGCSGIIVFFIAEKVIKNDLISYLFAFSFLSYLPLRLINIFDFHVISLAIPLLLAGFLCFLCHKKHLSLVFFFLAGLCKEEILLVLIFLGIVLFLFFKERKMGIILVLYGGILFICGIFIIPKIFGKEYVYGNRYAYLGDSLSEIIQTVIRQPYVIITRVFKWQVLLYIIRLLGPLAFLPVLAPLYLIMCLPIFSANVLSDLWQQRSLLYHYVSGIIPFLFIAGIMGAQRFLRDDFFINRRFTISYNRRIKILSVLILSATFLSYGRPEMRRIRELNLKSEFAWCQDILKKTIPDNASVSAESFLVPHLSGRQYVYLFPELGESDYIAFYDELDSWPLERDERDRLMKELPEKGYQKIFEEKGLRIFRKAGSREQGAGSKK